MNEIRMGFSDVLVYDSSKLEKGESKLGRMSERFFDFGQRRLLVTSPDWANSASLKMYEHRATPQLYVTLIPKGKFKLYIQESGAATPPWWTVALKIAIRVVLCSTILLPLFFAYHKYKHREKYKKNAVLTEERVEKIDLERVADVKACVAARAVFAIFYAKLLDSVSSIITFGGGSAYLAISDLQKHLQAFLEYAQGKGLPINRTNIERTIQEMAGAIRLQHTNHIRVPEQAKELREKFYKQLVDLPLRSAEMAEFQQPGLIILPAIEGHAVLYEIHRTEREEYSFKVINTGEGSSDSLTQPGKVEDCVFNGLSLEKLMNASDFLFDYEKLLPANIFVDLLNKTFFNEKAPTPSYARVHSEQKKGTCFTKCVTSWLNGRLGDDYFPFKAFMSEASLVEADAAFERIKGWNLRGKWLHIFGVATEAEARQQWEKARAAAVTIIAKRQAKAALRK